MKKLVFFPSDPIDAYIEKGRTYDFLDQYYNPGGYFDEVYCISPWGDNDYIEIGKIHYIKADPIRYRKIIKKIHPDVIRGYGGYCGADWVSISKVKGIPTIVSVHDTNPDLIHDSIAYADGVICMSNAVKASVVNKIMNIKSNFWVLPNRIDVDLYSFRENISKFEQLNHRFPSEKHILHVGRKTEQKNLDTVIRALQYIEEDVSVIFVGQGDEKPYKSLAKEIGVDKRCYWVDRLDSDELPVWYSWCDCMCTPSRWEGFGYVFIEAMACESVVITSNIAPMNEYLVNGKNAILVDEYENPHKIAEAMQLALSKNEYIDEIKKNARKVGLLFDKREIDKREVAIYDEIINYKSCNRFNIQLFCHMVIVIAKKALKNVITSLYNNICDVS